MENSKVTILVLRTSELEFWEIGSVNAAMVEANNPDWIMDIDAAQIKRI